MTMTPRIKLPQLSVTTLLSAILLVRSTERSVGVGVTVVTHGLQVNNSYPNWLDDMGSAIAARAGTATAVIHLEIGYLSGGGVGVTSFRKESGLWPVEGSTNAEVVVKLYWYTVAGLTDSTTTTDVANIAVPYLLSPIIIGNQITNRPLAEMPIHLIGHSRGASVVSEISRLLAQRGIWVDQATTLDPHPIGGDGPVTTYDNVLFADNYFQIDSSGLFPISGEHVDGTSEEQLTALFDTDGINDLGNFSDHIETHDWYYGTIDLGAATASGDPLPRSIWYPLPYPFTYARGFQLSRIAGGQWLRENSGLLGNFSGNGWKFNTNALRSSGYTVSGTQWPNVFLENTNSIESVDAGQIVSFDVRYRDAFSAGYVRIDLGVDDDENPYNNTSSNIFLTTTNAATHNQDWHGSLPWAPRMQDDGKFVYARITDVNGLVRYYYLLKAFHVVVPPAPFLSIAVMSGGQDVKVSLNGTVGQHYTVQASVDFTNWSSFASFSATNASTAIVNSGTSGSDRRFYRAISP